MATNLAIDDRLIETARQLGGHRTKKATVETALRDYIQRQQQGRLRELFGTVEFDASYDYKAERERRRDGGE
jgi:Arc/MetJ family transcription regulator